MEKDQNTTFYRNTELDGIEITRVIGSEHIFPKHVHDNNHTLVLVEEGASYCVGPENGTVVNKKNLALINPGQVHSGIPVGCDRLSYWSANIRVGVMATLFGDLFSQNGGEPEFTSMIVHDPSLQNHLRRFFLEMTGPTGKLERESALTEALARIFHESRALIFKASEPQM